MRAAAAVFLAVAAATLAAPACAASAAPARAMSTASVRGALATPTAPARAAPTSPNGGGQRAPSVPPLGAGSLLESGANAEAEASSSAPASGGDPLAANGLDSPLCRDDAAVALPASAARDCRVSGFEATPAPGGDYAFDVHINTGPTEWGNDAAATTQDAAQLGWTALVAAVRGVIVMLDWCFTVDLLGSPAMSGLARGLRATQATFTRPWLVLVLAIAAVLAAYHGLVRRRVAQTVGDALLMIAMMAGGLWVIVNPAGTVGALGAWANQASLGTLGAVIAGTPAHPVRTLAESNQNVFTAAIEGPWCYLEFGDVGWCENAARLDPRLRAAALKIAAEGTDAPGGSAALLRAARTNGELFLALPANQVARNSIRTSGALFNVLCGGAAEPCKGPTASQAEFRTQSGTGARIVGLAFIWFGLLGMFLVLGSIALRLLAAAIMSLVYLLLTPAAVLAPALGEGGRAAFRMWASRLVGAVTSKLVFSFLLGTVLAVEQVLASVRTFGWLTQWLLISSLWWMAFRHRHHALDFLGGARGTQHHSIVQHRSIARRAAGALGATREVFQNVSWAKSKLTRPAPSVERRQQLARARRERAGKIADAQVMRSLEPELAEARAAVHAGPHTQARLAVMRAQLERVRTQQGVARNAGDKRRTARLGAREQRLAGGIARTEESLRRARGAVSEGERAKRRTGASHTRAQREERARFLDAQAALPAAGRPSATGERREYAALAGMAGVGRRQYERLDSGSRRAARLVIDRELALRKELGGAVADLDAAAAGGSPSRRETRRDTHRAARELDWALAERLRSEGQRRPRASTGASTGAVRPEARKRDDKRDDAAITPVRAHRQGSSVMEDAREVAAGRKRQLGRESR
jgi:hypothetical protein